MGMSRTRIYKIWSKMKERCNNPKSAGYKSYGGKGIKYDASWEEFKNFYKDMSQGYLEHLTIDRIDNNKGYFKENCRWATKEEQNKNKTPYNGYTYNGKTLTLKQHAQEWGIPYNVLKSKIYYRKMDFLTAVVSSL